MGPELIDRQSPVPLYHQLVAHLRHAIEDGTYAIGELLPSESELGATYGVSRSVIRQGLTNLANDGLIRTERGRGSFVAERKLQERFVQRTTGLYDDLIEMGRAVRTAVVVQERTQLPRPVAEFFGTDVGVRIDRVRSVDDRPLAYIRTYVAARRCPGIERADLEDRSLYGYLQDAYGLRPASGRRTVEAVAVPGPIAKHLAVDAGSPILRLGSRSWDDDGEPLEAFEAWHRADRTLFEIDIVPDEGHAYPVSSVLRDRDAEVAPLGRPLHLSVVGVDTTAETSAGLHRLRPLETALATERFMVSVPRATADAAGLTERLHAAGVNIIVLATDAPGLADALAFASGRPELLIGVDVSGRDAELWTSANPPAFVVAFVDEPTGVPAGTPTLVSGYTPAELHRAATQSSGPVRLFPAHAGGPAYVGSVVESLADVPLVAAGALQFADLPDYYAAGVTAIDVGGLVCPKGFDETDEAAIQSRVAAVIEALP